MMKFQTLKIILFFVFFLAQSQVYSQCEVAVTLYNDIMPTDGMWTGNASTEPTTTSAETEAVYLVEVGSGYSINDPEIIGNAEGTFQALTLSEGSYMATIPAEDCDKNFVIVVVDNSSSTFELAISGTSDYTPVTGDNDNDFIVRQDLVGEVTPGGPTFPIAPNASVSGIVTFAAPTVIPPTEVEVTYPINSTDNEIYFAGLDLSGGVTYSIDGGVLTGANGSSWTLDPAGYITYTGGSVEGSGVDMITIVADNGTDTDTTYVTVNLIEEPIIITPTEVEVTYPINSTDNEVYFAGLDLDGVVTYSIDGGVLTGANGSDWTLDPAGYITYTGGSVEGSGVDMITIVADNGTDTDTTYVTVNLTEEPTTITPTELDVTYPINSMGNEIYFAGLDLDGVVTYSIDGGVLTGANGSSWTLDPSGYITYDAGSVDGSGVDVITIVADNGTDTDTTYVTVNLTNDPNPITPTTVEATYPVNSTDNEIYFAGLDLSGAITYSIDGGGSAGANGSNWTLDPAGYITYTGGSVEGNDIDMITIVANNGTDTDTTYVVINLIEEPNIITPTTVEATYPINSTDNEIYFAGLDLDGVVTYSIDGGVLTGANGSSWTLDPAGYITYTGGSVEGNDIDMITIVANNGTDTDTTYVVINLIEEPNVITPTTVEATYPVNSTDNEIYFAGLDLDGVVTYSIDGGGSAGANGSSWTLDPAGYITYTGGSVEGNDIDMITIVANNGTDTDTTYLVVNLIEEPVAPTEVTVFGGGNDDGLLPVELISFSGTTTKDCTAELKWATATETENAGFYVERSMDGRTYKKISWIKGAGNSSETLTYSFVDEMPSKKSYYRLQQVDHDGTYEYSRIISVMNECGAEKNEITLFPSPARNFLNLGNTLGFQGEARVVISDYSGKIHVSQIITNGEADAIEKIDISNLTSGLYLVRIFDESNHIYPTQKIMKY